MEKILVTGAAGFIGFHLVNRLIRNKYEVYGIDNINDYYDTALKYSRLKETGIEATNTSAEIVEYKTEEIKFGEEIRSNKYNNYRFKRLDIQNKEDLFEFFKTEKFDYIINLAAQAGVRYSIENPDVYIQSNIVGFFNILEACRNFPVKKLLYASSSSVYGNNSQVPFSTNDKTDKPVSLYAATKKSNELMAHTYSHLYKIPTIGLRFFTVYGSWGRPDMAPILFTNAINNGIPLNVFNNGELERDFTHVSDIVEGIVNLIAIDKPEADYYKLFNIGNGTPVKLMRFINLLESALGKNAKLNFMEMQPGDVKQTWAEIMQLKDYCGYKPKTKIEEGILEFTNWYRKYEQSYKQDNSVPAK